jgi:acyl-CoA reductase-like NAD-dependent aldehyde dehydrogenase
VDRDVQRMQRMAALKVGTVWVNNDHTLSYHSAAASTAAWSARRLESMREYTQGKSVWVDTATP